MKKTILRVILVLLLLALIGASNFVTAQIERLDRQKAAADELLRQQQYDQAIPAYAQLLQKSPISFLGRDKAFVEQGMAGVDAAVDALLETLEGARYLTDSGAVDAVLALATHPAVSSSFRTELKARESQGAAMLEAERQRQAALQAEAERRQALLEDGLQARAEGRLEEAVDLVKASGLQPELVDEIEAQIVREHDEAVAVAAQAALDALQLPEALALAAQAMDESTRDALVQQIQDGWGQKGPLLRETYRNRLWAGAWYTLALGDAAHLSGDKRYEGLETNLVPDDALVGGMFGWMKISGGKVTLMGDTLGAERIAAKITDAKGGALGWNHGLILHENGTVTNLGNWTYGRRDVADWTGIQAVAAGGFHSLGLTAAGTVVAAGLDLDGQCQVSEWTDVAAIAAGLRHSVALTRDGRVLAAGDDSCGQCDVSDWQDIVDVRCGGNFTLGLTADGRLLAAGDNSCGQCDVSDWKDVVAFDGGLWHTAALLQDGHLVAAGSNGHDQCALQGAALFETGCEAASANAFAETETEYVYTGDPVDGPWLYYGGDGSVIISFDVDTGKIKATRADLICTYGHPPEGILAGGSDVPRKLKAVAAAKLARQNKAVFALTGDHFIHRNNPDGVQIRRGYVIRDKQKTTGFGFFPDGSMRFIDPKQTTAEELLSQGVNDSWVFGPALIEHGEALDIHKHPLSHNDVTMRSVVASFCPYHHIGAAYSFSTLAQVAEDLLSCGCEIAYNLDGGKSCMLVFMGNAINRTAFMNGGWRALVDMVGFLTSDLVPGPNAR